MAARKRVYTGPKAGVLLLANGLRIKQPETYTGKKLHTLLKRHPVLKKYYPLSSDEEE